MSGFGSGFPIHKEKLAGGLSRSNRSFGQKKVIAFWWESTRSGYLVSV